MAEGTKRPSRRPALLALLIYVAVAILATWPLLISSGEAPSLRGDYQNNLWNIWWFGHSVMDQGVTPYWTDHLHHPVGISLARHTLSPVNAFLGTLLMGVTDIHGAFNLLIVLHYALSGWFFFLFARELTRCTAGALIAGLVWTASPFQYFYVAQMNLTTLEFLPLAGWFIVRTWRGGGWRPMLGIVLSAALLAASSSYYLVYTALLGVALVLGARFWDGEVSWSAGLKRLLVPGVLAAGAVVAVAWPLLSETFSAGVEADGGVSDKVIFRRSNDLLGFSWVASPEQAIVSWPTMLGYVTLAIVVAGFRRTRQQMFWLVLALLFFVLGLGPKLHVGGSDTGVPLPYAWLSDLPLLSMLRKPDRFIVMVQLCVALLAAHGWRHVALRIPEGRRRLAMGAALALVAVESSAAPLRTWPIEVSPYLQQLADDDSVNAVVHLPHYAGSPWDARANYSQTHHGKRMAQGYTTNLAISTEQEAQGEAWRRAQAALRRGNATPLVARMEQDGIDVVIVHKTAPTKRPSTDLHERTVWAPFVFTSDALLHPRQMGSLTNGPIPGRDLRTQAQAITAALGEPVYEDDRLVAFRRR